MSSASPSTASEPSKTPSPEEDGSERLGVPEKTNRLVLHGRNIIAGEHSARGERTFTGVNPSTGQLLDPAFHEATADEIDAAVHAAEAAFHADRRRPAEDRAHLLERIADEIEALGDALIERADAETALGEARLRNERGRTAGQLRLFAKVVREGSWVDARIDRGVPYRQPVPKPDIRRMLVPIGPVAVFGASNFPLAFSVAGGDTASALAAGCPVVCKAHPAHPGTSELVAEAVTKAVRATGFHPGTFSLVYGTTPEVSLALVRHPLVKAVGFTGSHRVGRALFDAAAARPEPIPVYAEMGSVNPIFVLPGALEERLEALADGLVRSVTLGAGQFCTNPGLVFGLAGDTLDRFTTLLGERIRQTPALTMLHAGICRAYGSSLRRAAETPGVHTVERVEAGPHYGGASAGAAVLTTDAATFAQHRHLAEEVFGPSTLIVACATKDELEGTARSLRGNLTATLHGTPGDLAAFADLTAILEDRVGRIILNGFPTGVEVCPSMQHGGPYPATTDARSTSVGTAALLRFARPIAWQDFPQEALPPELRDRNERDIWRLLDNHLTKEDV